LQLFYDDPAFCVACPVPNDENKYFIVLTQEEQDGTTTISYIVIDMLLDNGIGDIIDPAGTMILHGDLTQALSHVARTWIYPFVLVLLEKDHCEYH